MKHFFVGAAVFSLCSLLNAEIYRVSIQQNMPRPAIEDLRSVGLSLSDEQLADVGVCAYDGEIVTYRAELNPAKNTITLSARQALGDGAEKSLFQLKDHPYVPGEKILIPNGDASLDFRNNARFEITVSAASAPEVGEFSFTSDEFEVIEKEPFQVAFNAPVIRVDKARDDMLEVSLKAFLQRQKDQVVLDRLKRFGGVAQVFGSKDSDSSPFFGLKAGLDAFLEKVKTDETALIGFGLYGPQYSRESVEGVFPKAAIYGRYVFTAEGGYRFWEIVAAFSGSELVYLRTRDSRVLPINP